MKCITQQEVDHVRIQQPRVIYGTDEGAFFSAEGKIRTTVMLPKSLYLEAKRRRMPLSFGISRGLRFVLFDEAQYRKKEKEYEDKIRRMSALINGFSARLSELEEKRH